MSRHVIMGVAGCGKSTVGAAVAARIGARYIDGDDLHPAENVAKMSAGTPLADADRWPWLEKVGQVLAAQDNVIVGCSALRVAYRDRIRATASVPVTFLHLKGDKALITQRMAVRTGHFMPTSLIDSQFATLENFAEHESFVEVNIDQPLDAVVAALVAEISR